MSTFITLCVCITVVYSGTCNVDEKSFEKVLNSLKNEGYVIEEGYLEWFVNRTGYAANPNFIYGVYNFERMEIENYHDHYISIRGHFSVNNFWFMYGTTALLFYGCLPPSSHYFSYRSYVNRRYNPLNTTNFTAKYFPEEDPYGSLGDMLNHRIVNHTFSDSLNRNISIFISTGDEITYDDISNAVKKNMNNSEYDINKIINLDTMPSKWVKYKNIDWYSQLLNGGTVDSVGIMLRSYNKPTENVTIEEFNQYFYQNQSVYKIYHKNYTNNSVLPRKPYNVNSSVRYNDNQTNIIPNEIQLLEPYYDKYIELLISFMTSTANLYQFRGIHVSRSHYTGNLGYGYQCIEWGTRCMADNRDCQYFFTGPDLSYLPNDNKTVQFIVGVVHADMNVCEWSNIVPYFPNDGIVEYITHKNYRANGSVLMDYEYRLSALSFPPNIDNNTIPYDILNKFFIISVMRPGTAHNYKYLNMTPYFIIDTDKLKYKDGYVPVERCYVNNITKTRPPQQNILPMTVVDFLKY
eukprot:331903_1